MEACWYQAQPQIVRAFYLSVLSGILNLPWDCVESEILRTACQRLCQRCFKSPALCTGIHEVQYCEKCIEQRIAKSTAHMQIPGLQYIKIPQNTCLVDLAHSLCARTVEILSLGSPCEKGDWTLLAQCCPRLRRVELAWTNITEVMVDDVFRSLPDLSGLRLISCRHLRRLMFLPAATQLVELTVEWCNVELLVSWHLQTLRIVGGNVRLCMMSDPSRLSCLVRVHIEQTPLDFTHLQGFLSLRDLRCKDIRSAANVVALAKLVTLESLSFEENGTTVSLYEDYVPIAFLLRLKSLQLCGLNNLQNLNFFLDHGPYPHLESISLRHCVSFNDLHFLRVCPNVTALDLTGTAVDNIDLREIPPSLQSLTLTECNKVYDLFLMGSQYPLNRCAALREVVLPARRIRMGTDQLTLLGKRSRE